MAGVTVVPVSTGARHERTEGTAGAEGAEAKAAPSRRRGRPPAQSGDETRAAIIAAAQRLFGGRGYSGVSMEALAAECGLNERALYYYFRSKRELFEAAGEAALLRFGSAIADRVFSQTALRDRISAYIEIFRDMHESEPDVLPFIGMLLVDWRLEAQPSMAQALSGPGGALFGFLGALVDEAVAHDELEPGVDRDGAVMYLVAIGMGVTLVSGQNASFPAMLDVLERLNGGTLYRSSPPSS
jgi:AcrR family transcriptional regulator